MQGDVSITGIKKGKQDSTEEPAHDSVKLSPVPIVDESSIA